MLQEALWYIYWLTVFVRINKEAVVHLRRMIHLLWSICGALLLPSFSHAVPVTVNVGDTLSIGFEFLSPFAQTPLGFGVQVEPVVPLVPPNSFIANTALYDGTQKLAEYPAGSGSYFGWSLFSTNYPLCISNPSSQACVDMTSIGNQTIDGLLNSTFLNGSQPLTFDLNQLDSVWVYAGTPNTRNDAQITSVSLNGNALWERLEPFSNKTIEANGPVFGPFQLFAPDYQLSFDGSDITIHMDLGLTGYNPGQALINTWETGIESIWSDKYFLGDGPALYGLKFDVDMSFNNPSADFLINVVDGFGDLGGYWPRPNCTQFGCTFYTHLGLFTPYTNQYPYAIYDHLLGDVAAHEFGHILGLCDEYPNSLSKCQKYIGLLPEGLMGGYYYDKFGLPHSLPVQERYFDDFLSDIENLTGKNLVAGMAAPILGYVDSGLRLIPAEGDFQEAPEPGTLMLLSLGLAGLFAARRKSNQTIMGSDHIFPQGK